MLKHSPLWLNDKAFIYKLTRTRKCKLRSGKVKCKKYLSQTNQTEVIKAEKKSILPVNMEYG